MDFDASLSQWFTPRGPATAGARLFGGDLAGARVLEPSAGRGALVDAALAAGAASVHAVEVDRDLARRLARRYAHDPRVTVEAGDFLAVAPRARGFDVVFGNPPYDQGMDTAHLEAWHACAPTKIGLLRLVALVPGAQYDRVWSRSTVTDLFLFTQRPSFSGTSKGAKAVEFAWVRWREATPVELATRRAREPRVGRRADRVPFLLASVEGARIGWLQ